MSLVIGTAASDPLKVLRQLKEAGVATQVVILSRNATVEAAVAAMKTGAADYLARALLGGGVAIGAAAAQPPAGEHALGGSQRWPR